MAFTVGLLGFLALDGYLEGIRDRRASRRGAFGGVELLFLGAGARLPGADRGRPPPDGRRQKARRKAGEGGFRLSLMVAIGIGLHNLGRGARDRLGLRGRRARARRLPGDRLRDPQHHRGPGDRRAAGARRSDTSLAAPARARPDRRRAGDPRRGDRRLGLQPGAGDLPDRGRGRRDRPGDRAAACPRSATRRAARCTRSASPASSPASLVLYLTGLLISV